MPAINYNDVEAIRAGQTAILRVYVGSALVWGPPPAAMAFFGKSLPDRNGASIPCGARASGWSRWFGSYVMRGERMPGLPQFPAVIFANGTDDDAPGLEAALSGMHVLFNELVCQPQDRLVIERRTIFLSRRVIARLGDRPGPLIIKDCIFMLAPLV